MVLIRQYNSGVSHVKVICTSAHAVCRGPTTLVYHLARVVVDTKITPIVKKPVGQSVYITHYFISEGVTFTLH